MLLDTGRSIPRRCPPSYCSRSSGSKYLVSISAKYQSLFVDTHFRTDAMKFHHLGQQLLDTNCLLLILKMFGLQEVSMTVVSKADSPENK